MELLNTLARLLEDGKCVSFYSTPEEGKNRKFVAEITKSDEEIFVFADSIATLLQKLERREIG
jgi:hypothetical protein